MYLLMLLVWVPLSWLAQAMEQELFEEWEQ
jgi:hypothetical protein